MNVIVIHFILDNIETYFWTSIQLRFLPVSIAIRKNNVRYHNTNINNNL